MESRKVVGVSGENSQARRQLGNSQGEVERMNLGEVDWRLENSRQEMVQKTQQLVNAEKGRK